MMEKFNATAQGLAFHDNLSPFDRQTADGLLKAAGLDGGLDVMPWVPLLGLFDKAKSNEDIANELVNARLDLNLPQCCKPHIHVHNVGGLDDDHFRINVEIRDKYDKSYEQLANSPLVEDTFLRRTLLPLNIWKLVYEASQPAPSTTAERMRWWARIRALATDVDATMSPYLAGEVVVDVEHVRPRFVEEEDGAIRIDLETDDLTASDFDTLTRTSGRNFSQRQALNLRDAAGGRRRVLMSPQAKQAVRKTYTKRRYRGAEAAKLLAHPESVLPEEAFDLSHYSDRVIAIGPPRYKATVSMVSGSADERNWMDGTADDGLFLTLQDEARPDAPPVTLDISEPAAAQEAQQAVKEAIANEEPYANIQGQMVRAEPVLAASLETWAPQDIPDDLAPTEIRPEDMKDHVLSIAENVDDLQFGEEGQGLPNVPDDWTIQVPASMASDIKLRPHQEEGYAKLTWWHARSPKPFLGGLIADDMGLGKTLQVLTLLAKLKEEGQLRPSLIVAPTSLLDNWGREAERFFPGAFPKVAMLRDPRWRGRERLLADYDLTLTSYESLARRDLELGRIPWNVVVCDEAQKIKNPTTRNAHAVKAMQANVLRLAMTGTPVENSLDELWSITDFFQAGLLGSLKEFRKQYGDKSVLNNQTQREDASIELRATLEPVMLRRMKKDVAKDLPDLHIHKHNVEMSVLQETLYSRIRFGAMQLDGTKPRSGKGAALAKIQRLLQVSSHPFLISRDAGLDPVEHCPKLAKTLEILDQIQAKGEKALIFAKWLDLQSLLARVIFDRYNLHAPILNGSVQPQRRQAEVDQFSGQPGFRVMILSARACGVGLNITAANHVIHYSREWNPAIESQATDRTYRIGQTRDVHVHLPITSHPDFATVEVTLDRLLQSKEALRDDFIKPSGALKIKVEDFIAAEDDQNEVPPPSNDGLDELATMARPLQIVRAYARARSWQESHADIGPAAARLQTEQGEWVLAGTDREALEDVAKGLPAGKRHLLVLEGSRGLIGFAQRLFGQQVQTLFVADVIKTLRSNGYTLNDVLAQSADPEQAQDAAERAESVLAWEQIATAPAYQELKGYLTEREVRHLTSLLKVMMTTGDGPTRTLTDREAAQLLDCRPLMVHRHVAALERINREASILTHDATRREIHLDANALLQHYGTETPQSQLSPHAGQPSALDAVLDACLETWSRDLVLQVSKSGLPLPTQNKPEIGDGVMPELVWPDRKLAVLDRSDVDEDDLKSAMSMGWTVYTYPFSADVILDALRAGRKP